MVSAVTLHARVLVTNARKVTQANQALTALSQKATETHAVRLLAQDSNAQQAI
jgi:hypothetical protein